MRLMIKSHHTNVCLQKFIAKKLIYESGPFTAPFQSQTPHFLLLPMLWCCWLQREKYTNQHFALSQFIRPVKCCQNTTFKVTSPVVVQKFAQATFLQAAMDATFHFLAHFFYHFPSYWSILCNISNFITFMPFLFLFATIRTTLIRARSTSLQLSKIT